MASTSDVKAVQSPKDNHKSSHSDALGDLFARLKLKTSSLCTVAAQHKNTIPAEGRSDPPKSELIGSTFPEKAISKQVVADKHDLEESSHGKGKAVSPTRAELEDEYMRKAAAFIHALPDTVEGTPHLIKVVSRKLRQTYAPTVGMDQKSVDAIKARFAYAIAVYINKVLDKGPKTRTAESIKQTLKDVEGEFLKLCSILVDEKYISLSTSDDVAGLVKYMLDIVPKAEPGIQKSEPESNLSVSNIKEWPAQTVRENRESIMFRLTCSVLTNTRGRLSYLYTERCCCLHQYQQTAGFGLGREARVHLYATAWLIYRPSQVYYS